MTFLRLNIVSLRQHHNGINLHLAYKCHDSQEQISILIQQMQISSMLKLLLGIPTYTSYVMVKSNRTRDEKHKIELHKGHFASGKNGM
jgi:hypothetical protein